EQRRRSPLTSAAADRTALEDPAVLARRRAFPALGEAAIGRDRPHPQLLRGRIPADRRLLLDRDAVHREVLLQTHEVAVEEPLVPPLGGVPAAAGQLAFCDPASADERL